MTDEPAVDLEEFDSLVEQAESGIEQAVEKLESGRLKDLGREDVRVSYLNQLDALLRTKLDILEAKREERNALNARLIAREEVEQRFDKFERRVIDELDSRFGGGRDG